MSVLQEGDPFQGPKVGSCLTLRNVQGDTSADTARAFAGKRRLRGEQQGKGAQEDCSAVRLAVSGFMLMGLVSGSSLANRSDPRSFLVTHASLRQDGFQRAGFWEVGRTYELVSVSSLLLTFPEFFP